MTDNLGLVHNEVRKCHSQYWDYDDLYQIGCIGLMEAAKKFDVSRGCKFSTLAVPNIRHRIWNAIQRKEPRIAKNISSDETVYTNDKNGSEVCLIDMLEDKMDIQNDFIRDGEIDRLHEVLNILEEKHRQVIKMFYGIDYDSRYTQCEIASMVGTSQVQVSRIIAKSLLKLKSAFGEDELYLFRK